MTLKKVKDKKMLNYIYNMTSTIKKENTAREYVQNSTNGYFQIMQ